MLTKLLTDTQSHVDFLDYLAEHCDIQVSRFEDPPTHYPCLVVYAIQHLSMSPHGGPSVMGTYVYQEAFQDPDEAEFLLQRWYHKQEEIRQAYEENPEWGEYEGPHEIHDGLSWDEYKEKRKNVRQTDDDSDWY